MHKIKTPNNTNCKTSSDPVEYIKRISRATGIYPLIEFLVIRFFSKRQKCANRYIQGKGIEVGALHLPLKVSKRRVTVAYLDRMDNKKLRKSFPELKRLKFVKVGIVDDGEKLIKIDDSTQDFIIANHFIEHCEDPLTTLKNHLRAIRKGGIVFWAVPNKNNTFDRKRPNTSNNHLWLDYLNGPGFSRKGHFKEWAKVILDLSGKAAEEKAKELDKNKYSIHYHVWTPDSFKNFLDFAKKKLSLRFNVLELSNSFNEFIVVLEKY